MKSLTEILRSRNFMREVSILLFGFAALGGAFAILLLTMASSDPEAFEAGVALLIQSAVYVALGMMIRRGSLKALWITGVLFILDTLLILGLPSGKGLGAAIVGRGILIFLLIRYIRRQQAQA